MTAMLDSPDHVTVGASDPSRTGDFLKRLGFEFTGQQRISGAEAAALYGFTHAVMEDWYTAAGSRWGQIVVVQTPTGPHDRSTFDRGAHALDLYTRDMDKSIATVTAAGGSCGPIGRYQAGPLQIAEVKAAGPDGLPIVFIATDQRRPSVLDDHPERLHSQVHSIVWVVDDVEAARVMWETEAGLSALVDLELADPAVAHFMGLEDPQTRLRLVMECDGEVHPARLEVLTFLDEEGPTPPLHPLTAGTFFPGFTVVDVDRARAALTSAHFGPNTPAGLFGTAPQGMAFLLRPSRSSPMS